MNVSTDAPLRSVGLIASSIAQALQIPDLSPADPTSFWRDIATALTQTYEGDSPADIARWLIFDKFDREWDPEEAVDEESGLPAISAYEEILEIANRLQQPGPDDQTLVEDIIAGDEEEEAGSDALAELSEDIGFSTADLGLETVLSQIHRGNLVISPEWQRSFVWKSKRKKRFIESLLINLPIPSILTWFDAKSQREYVIDGRQRLETLVRFCSTREQLEQLQINEKPFKTFSSKEPLFAPPRGQLREVANRRFDQFPQNWKERLYRQTFRIIRFNRLTRPQLYQVFERYNTGGIQLQAQEIRNAVFQNSALHRRLWSLAREYADPRPEPDADIDRVSNDLRARMDRKVDRYGVYSFIGRVMAFTYFHAGRNHPPRGFQPNYTATVASATNDFMEDYEGLGWEELRSKWIRMYDKTIDWYTNDMALVRPTASKVPFHAFLATVQLATTPHLLTHIDAGQVTEESVIGAVRSSWRDFAFRDPETDPTGRVGIVFEKQNSTLFWSAQRRWLDLLRGQLRL
ncbi:MAG TPA: DUF262 domain-containing protein [Candidatus Dormibacteraeota bacterium]|nr:DUF262 domain-containing protein [Candidatus Dormibacteraeota bacterium]